MPEWAAGPSPDKAARARRPSRVQFQAGKPIQAVQAVLAVLAAFEPERFNPGADAAGGLCKPARFAPMPTGCCGCRAGATTTLRLAGWSSPALRKCGDGVGIAAVIGDGPAAVAQVPDAP